MQLVAVVTTQLDIGHDGALYHCLSHGSWPNRVILGPPSMISLLIPDVRPQFLPFFWQRFADYYGKKGRLSIRYAVNPSQSRGGVIL